MKWPCLPLLLITAPAIAQDAPAHAPETQLAFGQDEARMTVPVTIAGAGPFRFIIDTGAQRTVISRELAGQLGLARGRDVRMTAMTGTTVAGTAVIPSISVSAIGDARVEAPQLAAGNIGASGLIGLDMLQGHAVVIDLDTRTMAVRPSSKRRRHDDVPGEIVVRARSLLGQLVVTDAWCDGTRVRVILDTGSVATMGNLALQRRLARRTRVPRSVTLISVTGDTMTADATDIDHVRIGGLTIAHLPVAYADAAPFRQFGLADKPAIMLGMDALQQFRRVEIDFANRELRLALPRIPVQGG